MATIEVFPEDIFSEENKHLKIPSSVLEELKRYAPKSFGFIVSSDGEEPELNGEIDIKLNIKSRRCMILKMTGVIVKVVEEIKETKNPFFGIEKINFEIYQKRIQKIILELGSVALTNQTVSNCLINLYKSYERNREETLKMLKNHSNLINYFNKENVFDNTKGNPNVINFIKGNPEKDVMIDNFIFEGYKLKVNYNLKDIRSNALLIEYTGKEMPIINGVKVLGIEFKTDKDNFILNRVNGRHGGSGFTAESGFNDEVTINPSSKIIYFTNKDLKLEDQSYNCGMIFIYYEKNMWPLKANGFRFDTLSLLGFLNKEEKNSIKDIKEVFEFKKRKFKNLSPENSLFLCFMLYENEREVMNVLNEIDLDNNLPEITEEDFYLFIMNNHWALGVRKVFDELIWLCEKYLEISENFEKELGSKSHLKNLRTGIKKRNFQLQTANFLIVDPRRALF